METITFVTTIDSFDDFSELSEREFKLMQAAREAMRKAYAPYSGFHVGAALLLDDDQVVLGSNQENMAYPSGICAERTAFFYSGANFPDKKIKMVAITAGAVDIETNHPIAPCGACRQVMLEYEMNQGSLITIIMQGQAGKIYRVEGVKNLLPLFFNEQGLKHH
jgi:cytidine deaminase